MNNKAWQKKSSQLLFRKRAEAERNPNEEGHILRDTTRTQKEVPAL